MPPSDTAISDIVLEFLRTQDVAVPHAFEFRPQTYALRGPRGEYQHAEFPWSVDFLTDLQTSWSPSSPPEVQHRIGSILGNFLASAGWSFHEQIISAATGAKPIVVTIRSAAAELYAISWELITLKSTGQFLGSIPRLLTRYEWPGTTSSQDILPGARHGRVLFAWSAAGGGVPAAEHQAALGAAFRDIPAGFDSARDVLPNTTLADLRRVLANAATSGPPIDALHLLCHGGSLGATCGLILNGIDGEPVTVDAGRLQQIIAPHAGMLRLVVVAACDSGNVGELGNHVGSVIQMLHRVGIPAVIGSRFPLSVIGSIQFTTVFYSALVCDRKSLEDAFLAARDELFLDARHRDWASVQLYSRESDGRTTFPIRLAANTFEASVPEIGTLVPLPTPQVSVRQDAISLLGRLQARSSRLSECLVEALDISYRDSRQDLQAFCQQELSGYQKQDPAPRHRCIKIVYSASAKINKRFIGPISDVFEHMEASPHFRVLRWFFSGRSRSLRRSRKSLRLSIYR